MNNLDLPNSALTPLANNPPDPVPFHTHNGKDAPPVSDEHRIWKRWTPTWTNVTIGNATVVGRYIQIGKLVFFNLQVVWGSTTSASGVQTFSLPINQAGKIQFYFGNNMMYDASAGLVYRGMMAYVSAATIKAVYEKVSGTTIIINNDVDNNNPFVWATSDQLICEGFYEVI